jgi:catechol 2,3-dioxygenase-like lactoylglutathione lyase family enzyme
MSADNIRQITPFMHVADLKAAFDFFALLGFECLYKEPGYGYFQRGPAGMRVLQSAEDDGAPFQPHRGFAYYVDVRDVDAIVTELRPKLEKAGIEFSGPRDQTWRQREFMIRAPDGNVFVFGQAIAT